MLLALSCWQDWVVWELSVAGKLIYMERRLVVSDPRAGRDNTLRQIEWLAGYHTAPPPREIKHFYIFTQPSPYRDREEWKGRGDILLLSPELIYNLIDINCHESRVRHTSPVTRGILNYQTRQGCPNKCQENTQDSYEHNSVGVVVRIVLIW